MSYNTMYFLIAMPFIIALCIFGIIQLIKAITRLVIKTKIETEQKFKNQG